MSLPRQCRSRSRSPGPPLLPESGSCSACSLSSNYADGGDRPHMATVFCSAGPRRFCGDLRFFADSEKKPQVFRNPGGSPALQNERPLHCHEPLHSDFFTASHARLSVSALESTILLPSHN